MLSQNSSSGGQARGTSEPLSQSQYSWPVTNQEKFFFLTISLIKSSYRNKCQQNRTPLVHTEKHNWILVDLPLHWRPGGQTSRRLELSLATLTSWALLLDFDTNCKWFIFVFNKVEWSYIHPLKDKKSTKVYLYHESPGFHPYDALSPVPKTFFRRKKIIGNLILIIVIS